MKSIEQYMKSKERLGDMFLDIINLDWIFSKWYEKAIIIFLLIWSIISLIITLRGVF
jgi:hypothetical protein